MRVIFVILMVISILSGLWTAIDPLLFNPEIFEIAEEYHFIIPYYGILGFCFWGGLAMFYAIITRKTWGFPLTIAWIVLGIIFTGIVGLTVFLDSTFLFKYMLATTPPQERDIALIAEMSSIPEVVIITNTINLFVFCFGFVYLLLAYLNRDYFCN